MPIAHRLRSQCSRFGCALRGGALVKRAKVKNVEPMPIGAGLASICGLGAAARILERAADLMDERGFAKGVLEDGVGRMCALGAIARAAPNRIAFEAARELLRARIAEQFDRMTVVERAYRFRERTGAIRERWHWVDLYDGREASIPRWNNHSYRTKRQVIAMLRGRAA